MTDQGDIALQPDDVVPENQDRIGFIEAFKVREIRALAVSRGASRLAMSTVSYGTMVYLATQGGTQLQISFVAAATYLASVLFGVQGGMLADTISKRMAIAGGYVAIAVMYLILPLFAGKSITSLLLVMFLSAAVMQVVSPSLKSAVALVSKPKDVAVVATSVTIASSIAASVGSSVLAPVLIKTVGLVPLMYLAAVIMLYGAWATLRLPKTEIGEKLSAAVKQIGFREHMFSLRRTATWFNGNRNTGALILVGAIAVSMYEAFTTLIPVYVRDVLGSDPTNAVYIFAPAGIGFLIGMYFTPMLIDLIGARKLAVLSVFIMSISMVLFGIIEHIAPYVAPFSPLQVLGWAFDVQIPKVVLAASAIALPANFGSTAAGSAIVAYINQRVPLAQQGATFGLQEVQENVATLILVMTLGAASGIVGPKAVFIVSPLAAFAMMAWLIVYSYRVTGQDKITMRAALDELVDTSVDE
ncbi:MAG: MFS transporter [Thermomicrobiales bacterium]|nr:MFS transporter [Thermomicrobiales bacterium]MCO5225037.1 MFS transporter [Thermomicrobiales bacterium]MCO5227860.1 MFS transporter [Thermomicrobiales bacterium]